MGSEQTAESERITINPIVDFKRYMHKLREYYLLYFLVLVVVGFLTLLFYLVSRPVYTATAVIGPQTPSPTSALYGSMSQSVGGGLASKLMGGIGTSSFFGTFQQMLVSDRLIQDLISKDHVLPLMFPKNYAKGAPDPKAGPASSGGFVAAIKHRLGRPTGYSMAPIKVQKYMNRNFSVTEASPPGGALLASFGGNSNNYMDISVNAHSPEAAQKLLDIILSRADRNIRDDQLADINSRIVYIENELKNVSNAETRDMLISILSNQEQIRMMTVADKRFSFTMVSPPYAQMVPAAPMPPSAAGLRGIFMALALWMALVAWAMKSEMMAYRLRWFYRTSRKHSHVSNEVG